MRLLLCRHAGVIGRTLSINNWLPLEDNWSTEPNHLHCIP